MTRHSVAIDIDGLNITFMGAPVLRDIRLRVQAGCVMGLLGPNGAGKSTLIRAMAGRLRPDIPGGQVRVFGEPVFSCASARAGLGWVPQIPALYLQHTVRENLALFARLWDLRGAALHERVGHALAWTALDGDAGAATLSIGQKSRLNIAVGVLHHPRVMLLDEPTAGVDAQSRERIYEMVKDCRRRGAAVVYSTHYIEEAERLCDEVVIVDQGRVVAQGDPSALVAKVAGDDDLLVIESAPITPTLGERLSSRGVVFHLGGVHVRRADIAGCLGELLNEFKQERVEIRNLLFRKPSLESVYLQITGRELRA